MHIEATMNMKRKIRILLIYLGRISGAEAARRIGISPQRFYGIMHKQHLTVDDLQLIADGLDCYLAIGLYSKHARRWI